jgi:transposase InsO family protein
MLDHVQAVLAMNPPTDVRTLRSFLGMLNFYHSSIPHFAQIASPLHDLLKKDCDWQWEELQEAAFQGLKQALVDCGERALKTFVPGSPDTVLTTDASQDCIAAVLSQGDKPVSFFSRRLQPRECNYSTGEKECLAIVEAVERYHVYLYGHRFMICTDNKALVSLMSVSFANLRTTMRIARWTQRLLRYVFDISYVSTHDNVADCFTRLPMSSQELAQESIFADEVCEGPTVLSVNVSRASDSDDSFTILKAYITGGWPRKENVDIRVRAYYGVRDELSIENGLIYRGEQVVTPYAVRKDLMAEAHKAHIGSDAMIRKLRELTWWPSMTVSVKDFVKDCVDCQMADKTRKTLRPKLDHVPHPEGPWMTLVTDIVGPFETGDYVLVVVDVYSHFPEVLISRTITSEVLIDWFRDLFCRYGLPKRVISDNGPQYVAQSFESFLKHEGVDHILTTPYHPSSNGCCERFNSIVVNTVKISFRKGVVDFGKDLKERLRSYRSTPHPATKCTPFKLMFGREMCDGLRASFPKRTDEPVDSDTVRENVEHYQEVMTERHNYGNSEIGAHELVMVKNFRHVGKGQSKWKGPFRVQRRTGRNTYILEDGTRVHAGQCSRYHGADSFE